ncbi:MAG TPA: hypothetical protein VKU01_25410 [Bryobacteraceae bacterium]|nr:hypothetical protein [Bryobacteraceae bacterium]
MTLSDLFFMASFLLTLVLLVSIAVLAIRRQWKAMRRMAFCLAVYVGAYAVALVATALVSPRRTFAAGERRCFDDWCVAALTLERDQSTTSSACPAAPATEVWVATVQVSSVAKRVQQRELGAYAELEDREGHRYSPCAQPARNLTDEIGPGEAFPVRLAFRMPAAAEPSGVLIRHSIIPGIVIIGDDESWLHPPALYAATMRR